MAFRTYQQGLKIATDTASQAISKESSLSSLSPLISPLPTLQQTFPLYISSAETYSHLLSSDLVPETEREAIKKRWRLVLERAEKVKRRIESLGGRVGKVELGDEGFESAIKRRGGAINGLTLDEWRDPSDREFEQGAYRDLREPDMPDVDVDWVELEEEAWEVVMPKNERWTVRQGTGADCSVAAGLGVCIEHNRLWDTELGSSSMYPRTSLLPRRSENGKHVVKLLLNGTWRQVMIDALLPQSRATSHPLHATTQPLDLSPSRSTIGPPWVPLAIKAYFKALGGYTVRGSDPGPDIHAFTGWIPERLSLREGFQREKEWKRIYASWKKGEVLVTLGTGKVVGRDLVAYHAYGVIGMEETESGERVLEVVDPGSTPRQPDGVLEESMNQLSLNSQHAGSITMTWDQVCGEFEAISLNWDPALYPNTAKRVWSWPKPRSADEGYQADNLDSNPRYRLQVRGDRPSEICLLLSQHITTKDRPLDDIALHVFEENQVGSTSSRVLHPLRTEASNPYSNGLHVLVRYTPRRANTDLIIVPSRDRGLFSRDFTLQALAPSSTSVQLDRIRASLPFAQTVEGSLTSRNAGGHPGNPSHMINPQYKLVISDSQGKRQVRLAVHGDREVPWNVKLVWGNGARVFELTEDAVITDSGAYSYGMAYCDVPDIQPGTYTIIVSTFEPGATAPYSLNVESSCPLSLEPIPAEGAGMYSRTINGTWSKSNAGGRPSAGSYLLNPKVEIILPKAATIKARLHLPTPLPHPINLTIFKRGPDGVLGDQATTTGPYSSSSLSGVSISKVKLEAGVYICIPSTYEKGMEGGWTMNIWSDVSLSADLL